MFKTLIRVIHWIGDKRKRLYIGFVYSFLLAIFIAGPIMVAAYALNEVILDAQGAKELTPGFLWICLALIIAFILLRFVFSWLRGKTQETIGFEMFSQERLQVGDLLTRVSLGYFEENDTGDISAAITTQMTLVELMGMQMVDRIVGGFISVLATILILTIFSPLIGLVCLCGVLLSTYFLHRINRGCSEKAPIILKSHEDLAGATIEYLRGMSVVKSFGREGASMTALRQAYANSRKINIANELMYAPLNGYHLISLKLAAAAIIILASYLALIGDLPLAYKLMMVIFSFSLFTPMEIINDSANILGLTNSLLDNLEHLKNTEQLDVHGKEIALDHYDIEFDDVTFAYNKTAVVKDATFKIAQNSTTAIVGPSGSGKTTICNLIARFYDVNEGSIKVGGHDVREFTCDSLLSNISMVFQKVYLFRDTVKNNIRFGKSEATDEEIIEAAKKARCHEFIMSLPDGYDTEIGEGGSSLSGGEKQRISIARAILKDAPIVILDEATSSVDPENEQYIQAAISALTAGKTIIIIAHRLATIEHSDQILVMDQGKIAQKGTHDRLKSEEGIYNRFLSIREIAEGWQI
jgi:ATP-binding cassette, subfamily B, bacterial IrtB/YbtQ